MCNKNLKKFITNPETLEDRELSLSFFIDTNRINARQKSSEMNQLEKWHKDKVILINSPFIVTQEILNENSDNSSAKQRKIKIRDYVYAITPEETEEDKEKYAQIAEILFPNTELNDNQKNDVKIVFACLKRINTILITNDGGSKRQPNGILGNKPKLKSLGITVMNDKEAVELVKIYILKRDKRIKEFYKLGLINKLPEWIGKD